MSNFPLVNASVFPTHRSQSPQSQVAQPHSLLSFNPRNASQFGVAKATMVATVVIRTHITAMTTTHDAIVVCQKAITNPDFLNYAK